MLHHSSAKGGLLERELETRGGGGQKVEGLKGGLEGGLRRELLWSLKGGFSRGLEGRLEKSPLSRRGFRRGKRLREGLQGNLTRELEKEA